MQFLDYSDVTTASIIKQGFFITPLITLMMTNQQKFIDIFQKVISENDEEIKNLDAYAKDVHDTLTECRANEDLEKNELWNILKKATLESLKNRASADRLANQTLVVAGFFLIIGYLFLIYHYYNISAFMLILTFLMIINRTLLGIRSIAKFYLFYKVAQLLNKKEEAQKSNKISSEIPI